MKAGDAGSSGETDVPGISERFAARLERVAHMGQGNDCSVVRDPACCLWSKAAGLRGRTRQE